ncbi:MAG TPA: hypothetical protein VF803_02035 [Candidatus Paceibacterota bacterium]
MMQVAVWKIYTIGLLTSLFNIWLGLVYSLLFIFNRDTRRMGTIFLLWWVGVALVSFIVAYWLESHGYGYLMHPRAR